MKRQWTQEQKAAIEEQGTLLVAAGAGSGKTAVLIERILTHVTNLQEVRHVDQFLVVTYTKAAAMEMKTRLREAIERRLAAENDLRLSEHLLTQLLLINQARITTLHALGSDILRQYFYVLGMEPNFHVMDESQTQILLRELTEKIINEAYEACLEPSSDRQFLQIVQFFSEGYKDKLLVETVLQVRQFAMSQPDPQVWLTALAKPYMMEESDFIASPWGRALLERSQGLLEESLCVLNEAIEGAQQPHGPWEYISAIEQDRQTLKKIKNLVNEIVLCVRPSSLAETGALVPSLLMDVPELENRQELLDILGLLQQVLAQSNPPRLSPTKKKGQSQRDEQVLEKIKDEVKNLRKIYKENLKILKKTWIVPSLADHLAAGRESGQIIQGLVDLIQRLMDAYAEEKRKRNCVDFSDLEHLPLKVFRDNPEVMESFRRQFHEVLVDEYQDISPVQEELLSMLSRPGHQFLVGDIKQSIYRFRMADPGLFNEKYTSFLPWKPAGKGCVGAERVIDLRHNFRSRPRIIMTVNEIFGRLMNRGTAEIDYDARAELIAAGNFGIGDMSDENKSKTSSVLKGTAEGEPVEIHIAERLPKSTDMVEWAEKHRDLYNDKPGDPEADIGDEEINWDFLRMDMEAARIEAHIVAQRIICLMDEGFRVTQGSRLRPVRYKDIAILMRSMVSARSIYREVFDLYGIPCGMGNTGASGYEPIEMEIVTALLKVIDNPHQDIPLLAVLRSFLVGLTAEDLSRIRLVCPERNFFEALCGAVGFQDDEELKTKAEGWRRLCAEVLRVFDSEERGEISRRARDFLGEEGELKARLGEFCRNLMRWRGLVAREPLPEFIWRIYRETNILDYVGMMPDGKSRQDNLLWFYEMITSFAQDHMCSLAAFLRYWDKARSMGVSWGLPTQGSSARQESLEGSSEGESDQIRFLTIHGSKGLEFPVVFVVGLGSNFNRASQKGKVLCHKDLGVGIAGADVAHRVTFPSPVQEAVRWVLHREMVAEEMRVFYVALTRAKEKLILVGTVKNLEQANVKPSSWAVRKAISCLEWTQMALEDTETPAWRKIPYSKGDILQVLLKGQMRKRQSDHLSSDERKKETDLIESASEQIRRPSREVGDHQAGVTWPYSHTDQWVKVSVTRLKQLWEPQGHSIQAVMEDEEDRGGGPRIEALALGKATHKLLQHIPWRLWSVQWGTWNKKQQRDALESHLHSLVERELIERETEQGVPLDKVAALLSSPLGERIFAADEIYTEIPFILGMDFGAKKQKILVQGVTDLVAVYHKPALGSGEYPGNLGSVDHAIVVDFKTDRVRPGQEDVLLQRYALQMAVYTRAVENLMGVKVAESLIYAIRANAACVVGTRHMEEVLAEVGLETMGLSEGLD